MRAIAALPATADMPPNNLLFQGSAGTGKTSLAQMLMTELNANCLVVPPSPSPSPFSPLPPPARTTLAVAVAVMVTDETPVFWRSAQRVR